MLTIIIIYDYIIDLIYLFDCVHMADDNSDNIVFIYNGCNKIETSRKAVASSCIYFNCLLEGSFREAKERQISIQMEEFSFEAFESIIRYANSRHFDYKQKFSHYIEVIQLAAAWMFDELVELIELVLIDTISMETIVNTHTLANLLNLEKLQQACEDFEKELDAGGTLERRWVRCPEEGHKSHHYRDCVEESRMNQDEDWDREPDDSHASLTEEERNRLADFRTQIHSYEFATTKRFLRRKCYK